MKFGIVGNSISAGLVAGILYMIFSLFTFRTLGGWYVLIAFLIGVGVYLAFFYKKSEKGGKD